MVKVGESYQVLSLTKLTPTHLGKSQSLREKAISGTQVVLIPKIPNFQAAEKPAAYYLVEAKLNNTLNLR
jgi:hypothetical protein